MQEDVNKPDVSGQLSERYTRKKKAYSPGATSTLPINVEQNELKIRKAKNGYRVVEDYKDVPKHPKKGLDPRGDRTAKAGDIIIPAKKRKTVEVAIKNKNTVKVEDVIKGLPKVKLK